LPGQLRTRIFRFIKWLIHVSRLSLPPSAFSATFYEAGPVKGEVPRSTVSSFYSGSRAALWALMPGPIQLLR
jgi:hypothetical protein